MFSKRVYLRWLTAASFLFIASCSQAENTDMPPVVKALEEQGLVVKNGFQVEVEMRTFASVAGDRPIAVYVLADGKAIVGTRLNAKAEPMDEQTLQSLVAQPISDQSWAELESSNWVLDGNADAKRVVYVFTDANCPYCHQFWTASRPWGWTPGKSSCDTSWLESSKRTVQPKRRQFSVRLIHRLRCGKMKSNTTRVGSSPLTVFRRMYKRF